MPRSLDRIIALSLSALSALSFSGLAGCTSQADGNYHGQALATLSGTLHSTRSKALEHPQVALVWAEQRMMHEMVGAEKVDAEGLFPQFKLTVYNPPPDEIYDEFDGERYTVGLVAVGTPTSDYTQPTQWYGVDFDRVVVYLPEATKVGGVVEAFLHGPQTAGFHVFTVKRLTEQERQAVLDCINALPGVPGPGGSLPYREVFEKCGGDSNDELHPVSTDLETPFDLTIVDDQDILTIVNHLPHW